MRLYERARRFAFGSDDYGAIAPLAREFIHPHDAAALKLLHRVPFFARSVKLFMRAVRDDFFHITNMAQKVRVGPQQLPALYEPLPHACKVLGIEEPEFYLEMDPVPNAYTLGGHRPSITITSGLVENLSTDEVATALAHECGHILCGHVLYRTMANIVLRVEAKVADVYAGPWALAWKPLFLALMYWARQSELSADRAAAVVMGGPRPVVDLMLRLAGGPAHLTKDVDVHAFITQAAAYRDESETRLNRFMRMLAVREYDHPFPAVRAREITTWCGGSAFRAIVAAHQERLSVPTRPTG